MLFLVIGLVVIVILIFLLPRIIKFMKDKNINFKNKKVLIVFCTIVLLLAIIFAGIKIYENRPNKVAKEERVLLENYILEKYDLDLKVVESNIAHRGNIGTNPGVEYSFTLKNSAGFEYSLYINDYGDVDLKTILSENPKLNLEQLK